MSLAPIEWYEQHKQMANKIKQDGEVLDKILKGKPTIKLWDNAYLRPEYTGYEGDIQAWLIGTSGTTQLKLKKDSAQQLITALKQFYPDIEENEPYDHTGHLNDRIGRLEELLADMTASRDSWKTIAEREKAMNK